MKKAPIKGTQKQSAQKPEAAPKHTVNNSKSKATSSAENKTSKPVEKAIDHVKEDDDDDEPRRKLKTDQEYAQLHDLPIEDIRDIRNLFNSMDADGGGEIDASELKSLLVSLGRNVTQAQAEKMIKEVDTDGGGTVDFEEFLKLIAKEAHAEKKKDPIAEARRIFQMFDKDKSGSIDTKELKEAVRAMGQNASDDEVEQMMRDADDDGTGEIDFEEFCNLIGIKLPESYKTNKVSAPSRPSTTPQRKTPDIKSKAKIDPYQILAKDEVTNLKEIFDLFDEDRSGSITIDEFSKMMDGLGRKVSEAQLKVMIASVDEDGTGAIEFEEFLTIMAKDSMDRDPFAEAMRTFQTFDADGSGTISAQELGEALRASGQDLSDEDAIKLLATVDADGSGEIEFDEFCQLMGLDVKKAKPEHLALLKRQAPKTTKASAETRLTEKQKKVMERDAELKQRKEDEELMKKQSRDEWVNLLGKPSTKEEFRELSSLDASFRYQHPLHKAAAVGNQSDVQCWCTGSNGRKLDADEQDGLGWTPIMWAASRGNKEVVNYLIGFGASLTILDFDKRQVLHLAVISCEYEIVIELLKAEAPPSPRDRFGDSPLHWAARHGYYHVVVALLAVGADINLTGGMSETALHWAAKREHIEICQLLVEKGAKLKILDDAGMTAEQWTKSSELKELIQPPAPPEPVKPRKLKVDKESRKQATRFTDGLTAIKMRKGNVNLKKKDTPIEPGDGGEQAEEDDLAQLLHGGGDAEDHAEDMLEDQLQSHGLDPAAESATGATNSGGNRKDIGEVAVGEGPGDVGEVAASGGGGGGSSPAAASTPSSGEEDEKHDTTDTPSVNAGPT